MCVCGGGGGGGGAAQGCNCLGKKILSFKGKIESLSKFLMNIEGGTRYLVLKDEADTIV